MMKINLLPKHWLIILIAIAFVGYVLFQARYLILGPQVWIDSPKDGEVVLDSVVTISGKARNAAWISLNDRQIFTNDRGLWSEKLIVSQGTSIMTVKVRDRFGRDEEKQVRIILN